MKLKTPFSIIKNALNDMQVMHDFNYEIPTETRDEFWKMNALDTQQTPPVRHMKCRQNHL